MSSGESLPGSAYHRRWTGVRLHLFALCCALLHRLLARAPGKWQATGGEGLDTGWWKCGARTGGTKQADLTSLTGPGFKSIQLNGRSRMKQRWGNGTTGARDGRMAQSFVFPGGIWRWSPDRRYAAGTGGRGLGLREPLCG